MACKHFWWSQENNGASQSLTLHGAHTRSANMQRPSSSQGTRIVAQNLTVFSPRGLSTGPEAMDFRFTF